MNRSQVPSEYGTGAAREATRSNIPAAAGYYMAFVALGLVAAVVGPTLPSLAERTRATLADVSIIFTGRSLGYLAGSLLGGHIIDRVRGHPVLAVMLAVIALCLAAVPLVPLLWILVAVMIVLGIAESFVDVGGNSLLIWLYRDKVGPAINGLHFCFGVGAFIAPVVVAQAVLATADITLAYWILGLLVLPGAVWLLFVPSPVLPTATHERAPIHASAIAVILTVFFMFLYVGAEGGYGAWVFTYATSLGFGDAATAAYLTSTFWGALTVGRFVGIPIASRVKPQTILLIDLAVCMVSVALMLVASNSALALWVGTIGAGAGMASIYPAMLSLAGRSMTITGRITGWISLGAGAGGMFWPWLIGQFFERIGPPVTMLIVLSDLAIALAVLGVLAWVASPRRQPA